MIYTITPSPCLDHVAHVDVEEPPLNPGTHRVRRVDLRPGGKGVDISRAVKALHGQTEIIIPLSSGDVGDDVAALIVVEGLTIRSLKIAGECRVNNIVITSKGGEYRFNTPAPALTPKEMSGWYQHIETVVKENTFVTIGGSNSTGLMNTWAQVVIEKLKAKGCVVALDAPRAVTQVCLGQARFSPDFIKPNILEFHHFLKDTRFEGRRTGLFISEAEEAEERSGGIEDYLEDRFTEPNGKHFPEHWDRLLRAVWHLHISADFEGLIPIVSLGRWGCLTVSPGTKEAGAKIFHAYCKERTEVVNRIGAGDSLLGAFLTSLDSHSQAEGQTPMMTTPRVIMTQSSSLRQAIIFAVAAATVRVGMTPDQETTAYISAPAVSDLTENGIALDEYPVPAKKLDEFGMWTNGESFRPMFDSPKKSPPKVKKAAGKKRSRRPSPSA